MADAHEALDDLLRELVASLNKVHLDPWTVGTLLDDRPVRGLKGEPIPGLGDAVWIPLRAPLRVPTWEIVDESGHVRAKLMPPREQSGYQWTYEIPPGQK